VLRCPLQSPHRQTVSGICWTCSGRSVGSDGPTSRSRVETHVGRCDCGSDPFGWSRGGGGNGLTDVCACELSEKATRRGRRYSVDVVREFRLIERHRLRVALLREEYRRAVVSAELACAELLARGLPQPDGSQAYRNALIAERTALTAYTEAVGDLNSLILESKPPTK
jgi:hypothetical protein